MKDVRALILNALGIYQQQLGIVNADLSAVPITEIGAGENNHMFKVIVGEKVFVFRVPYRPELIPKLKQEFAILQHIPPHIGPEALVLHEGVDTFMIQSFVAGIHPVLWNSQLLQAHVAQMARLHSSDQKAVNGIDIVQMFQEKIDFRKLHDPEVLAAENINEIIIAVSKCIEKSALYFAKIKSLALIHGDLHNRNILVEVEAVHYIDWEEARYGDYALDVAGLLLSPEVELDLSQYLEAYQAVTKKDEDLFIRVLTWLLYKDVSLLLHKKWESFAPQTRANNDVDTDYVAILEKIITRIKARILLVNKSITSLYFEA